MDQREKPDRIEPMLATEPTEIKQPSEPADPMDKIEPAEPIDKIEPDEPMDNIEPLEPMLRIDPDEPAERDEPLLIPMQDILPYRVTPRCRGRKRCRVAPRTPDRGQ
jgi:hypothetical protein